MPSPPFFDPGVGYGLIVGLGAAFAIVMSLISLALARYKAEVQTIEMYMTAKHSVKTGLTASAVVSSWTIAATLLSSTTEGYLYGVSGPFWYGAGASVQIFLFAVAAIELKRKAPKCHTFLEVVRARYGTAGHIPLMCYSFFYQLISAVNLLVGGSTIFSTLTGVNRDAACFLLPISVVIYTLFGGIKATFLTDWAHTVIIYIVMLLTLFVAYTSSSVIGSPDKMWQLLSEAAILHPVAGNADGSYLTMKSQSGGYVGLIFVGAGFAASVDSQLFQKAIAADPASTLPGYILGGLCWFTIPFVLATTFGLSAAALEHTPSWPTYPERMTSAEIGSGMAMPYAAYAMMGEGGVIAILLMVFMAVTSAMSSETVATSALTTYDIYKAYINPNANSAQLQKVSHIAVVAFGIVSAAIAVAFNHAGFSTTYLITAIGIFVDSAIVPMACTIMWKKQSLAAVVLAPILSSIAAIIAWLLTAYTHFGTVSIATTSEALPLVAGNMMSLCGPLLLTPLITYIRPANFDWSILKEIKTEREEFEDVMTRSNAPKPSAFSSPESKDEAALDAKLLKARTRGVIASATLCLSFLILWPIPMYGTNYVFSKAFFRGWIVIVFLWAFFASLVITLYPLWEGRASLTSFLKIGLGSVKAKAPANVISGVDGGLVSDADLKIVGEKGTIAREVPE